MRERAERSGHRTAPNRSNLNIATLTSYLREVAKASGAIPGSSDVPEERLSLVPLRKISQETWNIDTVESYDLASNKPLAPSRLWDSPISFLESEYGAPSVSLDYFIDGVQRTTLLGTIPFRDHGYEAVPWQIAQIGCTILRRDDRHLHPLVALERIDFLLLTPIAFLRDKRTRKDLDGFFATVSAIPGVRWIDTSYRSTPASARDSGLSDVLTIADTHYPRIPNDELFRWLADPDRFRHHGRYWVTRLRDSLERDVQSSLADTIAQRESNVLSLAVKDGSLRDEGGLFEQSAIGLVKSLRTQYLGSDHQAAVINLPEGYRSPVFMLSRPSDPTGEAISEETGDEVPMTRSKWLTWFLRMRPQDKTNPRFGLLRLEIDPRMTRSRGVRDKWSRDDSLLVSAISRAVHRERAPSSYPDPRWGNLIYPIALCERYLRSRLIPHEVTKHFGSVAFG